MGRIREPLAATHLSRTNPLIQRLIDRAGQLGSITLYKRGAEEVVRRLAA